jgi:hypothetical protein
MRHRKIIPIIIGLLAGSQVLAQGDSGDMQMPCTIEPVYHCAEPRGDGGYIAHFGYRTSCPESGKPIEDVFIDIGEDNYFSPGPVDRGQTKVFVPGEHVDDFEVEFTAEELETNKNIGWTVLKIRIPVDFSRLKDNSLDCTNLPY